MLREFTQLRVDMTRNFDPKALARALKFTGTLTHRMGKTRRLVEPFPPEKEPKNPVKKTPLTGSWLKDRAGAEALEQDLPGSVF